MSCSSRVDPAVVAEFDEQEKIEDMRECARLVTMGATAARLSDICLLAHTDCDAALQLFREADKIPSASYPELMWLRQVVLTHICQIMAMRGQRKEKTFCETDLQRHFFAHLEEYIPGACKVQPKTTKGHKPDGFILLGGETMPVEAKVKAFTNKSLEQLEWYMRVYGMKHGVAVAQELTCALPDHIRFVRISAERLS
jgi:hypothetical protein